MSKPSVKCCNPRQYHAPSGLGWFHERDCPVGRGQKLRNVFNRAETNRSASHARETADAGVVTPITAAGHPAGTARPHAHCTTALTTGVGVVCSRCAWLLELDTAEAAEFDAHLDDGTSA